MTVPGSWNEIEIGGKIADVYLPINRNENGFAAMHLHGHGMETLADKPVFTAELERHGLPTVCPRGKRSWWLDVVCTEFDEQITPRSYLLRSIIPWMKEEWNVSPPRIALTGISMGGQGVLQLAYRYPREFPVVAAISPAVDFHNWHGQGLPIDEMFADKESARQATAILQVRPLNWPRHQFFCCDPADVDWFESSDRLAMKLSSSGIPFECDLETTHGGHSWDYFNHQAPRVLQFVVDSLESAENSA